MWIWKLHCPGKIKYFLWQCLHNRLPYREYLQHIGINIDCTCPMCHKEVKSIVHIFIRCPLVQPLWRKLGIESLPLTFTTHWLIYIKNLNPKLESQFISWTNLFPFLIWGIWINRNNNNTNLCPSFHKILNHTPEYHFVASKGTPTQTNITIQIK